MTETSGTILVGISFLFNVNIHYQRKSFTAEFLVYTKNSFLPSSLTQYYWVKLSLIAQNSSLQT